ncbi:MAG: HAD-IA family hydrolase [Ornithinimicrobium sp.]|uniref:HAD-IA family hydrolase n=1 Tax=Ornithinimicrobium sp. TaxID=1977084 RepID=UPI0026E0C859|nr:HAD-IA family hydrolase [Ornithinimicrobium sp.]MDO5740416.1 HAD-IA family hydrolase [Ornithinimicrobium sp.]
MRDILTQTFDAVLFDNDGTLIDSHAAVERSWAAWALDHGIPAQRFVGFHGMPSRGIVARVAPELDDLEAAVSDIDRRELEDTEGVVALPGAAAALSALGARAAIVTSAGRDLARRRIGAAGLTPPVVMVTADDIPAGKGKPDPLPYLTGAARLGVDPARCLVVEDAPAGLRAGRAAGAAVVGITSTSNAEELEPLADLVVSDLSQLTFTVTGEGVRIALR